MFTAENLGFIKQTEIELQKRISKANSLCSQFSNFKGTSTIKEIILLVILSLLLFTSMWALINSKLLFSILQNNSTITSLSIQIDDLENINIDDEEDVANKDIKQSNNTFFIIAIISVCIYLLLHILNKLLHLLRIFKLDNHIFNIHNIDNYLRKTLNNISSIALEVDKIIFEQKTLVLQPKFNTDERLRQYDNIIKTYSNPEQSNMKSFLMFLHWLSSILFMCISIYISFPFSSLKIGQLINTESNSLVLSIHISCSILFLLILQEFIAKSSHIKLKYTLGYILIICLSSIIKVLGFIISGFIKNLNILGRIIGYILLILLLISPIILCSISFAMDNLPINTFRDLFRGESLAYIGVYAIILIVCYLLVNFTHGLLRGIATFVAFALAFSCVITGETIGIIAFILSVILLIVSFVKPFSSY